MGNLHRKALIVSYFSAGYHILEGVVSMSAGVSANSIALLGFGLDSFVESFSGFIIIWRFWNLSHLSKHEEDAIEKKALKYIAYSFFLLAAYVLYESVRKLYLREASKPSILGIIIAIVSLIVMPIFFLIKRKTGQSLKSHSLIADSKQQLACILLSLALLIGLGLNYFFGFWQADPVMGLIIVLFLIKEGIDTLREEKACHC